jgi:hypothetical protein
MYFKTLCPHCGAISEVAQMFAGRRGRCDTCRGKLRIPRPQPGDLYPEPDNGPEPNDAPVLLALLPRGRKAAAPAHGPASEQALSSPPPKPPVLVFAKPLVHEDAWVRPASMADGRRRRGRSRDLMPLAAILCVGALLLYAWVRDTTRRWPVLVTASTSASVATTRTTLPAAPPLYAPVAVDLGPSILLSVTGGAFSVRPPHAAGASLSRGPHGLNWTGPGGRYMLSISIHKRRNLELARPLVLTQIPAKNSVDQLIVPGAALDEVTFGGLHYVRAQRLLEAQGAPTRRAVDLVAYDGPNFLHLWFVCPAGDAQAFEVLSSSVRSLRPLSPTTAGGRSD